MVLGKIINFCFDILVELIETLQDTVMGPDHAAENLHRFLELFILRIFLMERPKQSNLFKADIDKDVICKEVVFPAPLIGLAGKNCFTLHHLEMFDDRFWGEHQGFGDLSDKTGFLPEKVDDAPTVPVPEDIEDPGNFNSIVHIYLMLV